jgi:hypothetical protein
LPQKAKRVIWLTMAGGPSQFETFDPKPKLAAMHGEPMPESITQGQQLAQLQGQKLVCSRAAVSVREIRQEPDRDLLAVSASRLGDRRPLLVRSMTTDAINHDPAHMFMNTGAQIAGGPAWARG